MVIIVVMTHGSFGEELVKSAELILGEQQDVHVITMSAGKALSEVVDELDQIIKVNRDNGIILLTDMFGGSPSNVAFSYVEQKGVEIISGVNLPMVIKALTSRVSGEDLRKLALSCKEAGRNSIKVAGELMLKK